MSKYTDCKPELWATILGAKLTRHALEARRAEACRPEDHVGNHTAARALLKKEEGETEEVTFANPFSRRGCE